MNLRGSDGTAYFWDVTDPTDIKKIDSIQVDARIVNDVKVSEDGKLCVISREASSKRKNGIILIDVTDPSNAEIISERLSALAAEKILENVDDILEGKSKFIDQEHSKATYAKKIEKTEGKINWNDEASIILGK